MSRSALFCGTKPAWRGAAAPIPRASSRGGWLGRLFAWPVLVLGCVLAGVLGPAAGVAVAQGNEILAVPVGGSIQAAVDQGAPAVAAKTRERTMYRCSRSSTGSRPWATQRAYADQ